MYFGQGSYGIKAAARRFFVTLDPGAAIPRGKQLEELTIGEAALLAGLISSPEGNNPFTYPDRAIRRRADVLRAEVEQGYVTQAEADAANIEPLPSVKPPAEQRPDNYLVAEVQDRLLQDIRLGNTPEERRNKLLKGGLKVYTTFDPRLQAIAQEATDFAKPQKGADWVSSLVAIDPSTGAVRAMVGGPDFADSQYNIATHTPGGRQPGSTWKVITLAAALQNGYSPNDTVDGTDPVPREQQVPGARRVHDQLRRRRGRVRLDRERDGALRELRVRAPVDQRRTGPGHRDGAAHGAPAGQPAEHPHPLDRHHRSHPARDGLGDEHHREHGRAPHSARRRQGHRSPGRSR